MRSRAPMPSSRLKRPTARGSPESIQEYFDPRLEAYRDSLSDSVVSMVENIAGLVQSNISQVITLIATPIAIFQILYQPKALIDALRRLVPGPLQKTFPIWEESPA